MIDEIEEISSHAYSEDYDSDRAILDLMRIHDIVTEHDDTRLTPFDRLFLETYLELRAMGLIDNH